jgi:hypothetical protein
VNSRRGLRIIGPMQALVLLSGGILVSLPLCFKLQTLHYLCIPFVTRTHAITLYSGHICAVLCINASVLTSHMDPG